MEKDLNYYNKEEIKNLYQTNARLINVHFKNKDDVLIIKYEDIPDFIVDYNNKFGQTDLLLYDFNYSFFKPIITTFGSFLNTCNPDVRSDIIDRLNNLQMGGKINDYKVIDIESLKLFNEQFDMEENIKI